MSHVQCTCPNLLVLMADLDGRASGAICVVWGLNWHWIEFKGQIKTDHSLRAAGVFTEMKKLVISTSRVRVQVWSMCLSLVASPSPSPIFFFFLFFALIPSRLNVYLFDPEWFRLVQAKNSVRLCDLIEKVIKPYCVMVWVQHPPKPVRWYALPDTLNHGSTAQIIPLVFGCPLSYILRAVCILLLLCLLMDLVYLPMYKLWLHVRKGESEHNIHGQAYFYSHFSLLYSIPVRFFFKK